MNNIFKRNCVSLMQSILLLLYEWFITIKIYWFLILIYYMYETLPPAFVKLDVLLQNGIGPWLLQGLSIERQFIALITSLVVFCFTSSTAFFTFIYKENKEIAHSYTYENQSFRLFILNLTLNFWSLVLFYFSDSFEKKAFGLFIGFLFYGFFILLTLINIFSYQFVRFKLFLLTHYLIKLNTKISIAS